MDLSVVIPVYNEEENISILYRQLKVHLKRFTGKFEIIIIDDGSTDSSNMLPIKKQLFH